jgi:mono/diheme cytochrome c family protein
VTRAEDMIRDVAGKWPSSRALRGRNILGRNPVPGLLPVLMVLALSLPSLGRSQPAGTDSLVITGDAGDRQFTTAALLARPDSAVVNVHGDVYHGTVPYRAVPLLSLLGKGANHPLDTIEIQSSDGFISQIPLSLVTQGANGGAVAWVAVEDPAHPWPPLPGKSASAGAFYLVWQYPERSGVNREQWPYQMVRISLVEGPLRRWPQLSVPANLPANSPVRRGQAVFIVECLPCHRLNDGGASEAGPDLGRPMNPTQYLTEGGLRAIVRDPKSVRTWPEQRMAGFGKSVLPDSDLDAVISYLRAMAPSGR